MMTTFGNFWFAAADGSRIAQTQPSKTTTNRRTVFMATASMPTGSISSSAFSAFRPHRAPPRLLPMRHFHNVALVGFMGTGKSTVGNVLASMLHLRLVDTDALIEQRAGN